MASSDGRTLDDVYNEFGELASFKEIFYDWMGLNKWLFLKINHIRADFYDQLMLWVTELGNRHHFPYAMALLVVFVLLGGLIKKMRKTSSVRAHLSRWAGVLLVLVMGFGANAAVIYTIKDRAAMPRPYVALAANPLLGEPQVEVYQLEKRPAEDGYRSFPSGHVAMITLWVLGLWPVLSDGMRKFGLFLIFAVAWSRLSLGVHFPADALWSFVISGGMVLGIRAVVYSLLHKFLRIAS